MRFTITTKDQADFDFGSQHGGMISSRELSSNVRVDGGYMHVIVTSDEDSAAEIKRQLDEDENVISYRTSEERA